MKILVIDAFKPNDEGRRLYRDFKGAVCSAFQEWKGFRPQIQFRDKANIDKFIYDPDSNFRDMNALNEFDKLDFIFIGGGQTVAPWSTHPAARAILSLLKMCSHTGKCVFGSSFVSSFLGYVLATGGGPATVINPSAMTHAELAKLVNSPKFTLKPTDAFLDYATGDLYQLNKNKTKWSPIVNTGLKSRTVSNKHSTSDTVRKMKEHKYDIGKHTTGKQYEYRCHVPILTHGHWMAKGIELNFVAPMRSSWVLETSHNKRCSSKYKVIVSSESNIPAVVQFRNMVCVQFEVERKYPVTVSILHNYVRRKMREILELGDIDRSSKILLNVLPLSKGSLVAPAPVQNSTTERLKKGPEKAFAMLEHAQTHKCLLSGASSNTGSDTGSIESTDRNFVAGNGVQMGDELVPSSTKKEVIREKPIRDVLVKGAATKPTRMKEAAISIQTRLAFRPRSIHDDKSLTMSVPATNYLMHKNHQTGNSGCTKSSNQNLHEIQLDANHVGATLAQIVRQSHMSLSKKQQRRPSSARPRSRTKLSATSSPSCLSARRSTPRPSSARPAHCTVPESGITQEATQTQVSKKAPKSQWMNGLGKHSKIHTQSKTTIKVVPPPLPPHSTIEIKCSRKVSSRVEESGGSSKLQTKKLELLHNNFTTSSSATRDLGEVSITKPPSPHNQLEVSQQRTQQHDSRKKLAIQILANDERKNSTDSNSSAIQNRGIRVRSKRGQRNVLRQQSPTKHMGRPKARLKQFNNWKKHQKIRQEVLDTYGPAERFSLAANGPYESPTERGLREHREGKAKWVGGKDSPFKTSIGRATTRISRVAGITWDGPYLPPSQHDFRGLKKATVPWT